MRRFLIRSTVAGLVGAILIWLSFSLGEAWIEWETPLFDVSAWTEDKRSAALAVWAFWQLLNYTICAAMYDDYR